MKFSFIVTATLLNLASSQKNPQSININLETAFEFEPNNSRQHLQFIDNVQQFLTKLRSALDTDSTNIARNNQGFNICKYIKETFDSIAKHKNIEHFFQAFRNDTKTRYNAEYFRSIFSDKNTRGHIKTMFADLNKTSSDDKRLMLKYAAMALGNEPESFMQLNEFFSEKDKNTFEEYIDKINSYRGKEKDVVALVAQFLNFLIYDRYKKLSSYDKAKVGKIIIKWSENPKDILLRTGSAKVSENGRRQKEFVLDNNLEISVNAVPSNLRNNNNQFNLKLVPIINYDEESKSKDKVEKPKENNKSETVDDNKESESDSNKVTPNKPDKIHEKVKNNRDRPKIVDASEIIAKDIDTLLGMSDKENDNTKAKIKSTEDIQSHSISEELHNDNDNKPNRIEVNKQSSVEHSVSQESQETRPKQKNKQSKPKKQKQKNSSEDSDESSKSKERKNRTFRNNDRREIKPLIVPVGTFQKITRQTNSDFIIRANSDNIVKDVRKARNKIRHDNEISFKDIQKKQDISVEDDETKTRENSEERKQRETFENAELSFKVLERRFNKIKSRKDGGLEVISPMAKEAYEIKRFLDI